MWAGDPCLFICPYGSHIKLSFWGKQDYCLLHVILRGCWVPPFFLAFALARCYKLWCAFSSLLAIFVGSLIFLSIYCFTPWQWLILICIVFIMKQSPHEWWILCCWRMTLLLLDNSPQLSFQCFGRWQFDMDHSGGLGWCYGMDLYYTFTIIFSLSYLLILSKCMLI